MSEVDLTHLQYWEQSQASRNATEALTVSLALQHGGGGGTSGGMADEALIDAKVEAAEARVDTKFVQLRGDLQRLPGKATIWGAVATGVGILIALLAFGGSRFDSGMSARSLVEQVRAEQRITDAKQDAKLDEILKRLPEQRAPVRH